MDAHRGTHARGGTDAIKLDDLAEPDDTIDLNSNTLRHGLLRKLSGSITDFLRGDGTWGSASGGSSAILTADPGSPADDTWWIRRTGTTPTMSVALRVRISGATYTLAEITL